MRDVIFTVRHSPGFHRRRNRHWPLKAQWWLLRHRSVVDAAHSSISEVEPNARH